VWLLHVPGVIVVRSTITLTDSSPPKRTDAPDWVPRPSRLIARSPPPALTPFSSVTRSITTGSTRSVS
jgi:hypothetical protein